MKDKIWVFGYGSLIWNNDDFKPIKIIDSKLIGAHRSFNKKSIKSRGTKNKPGLALGLEYGGKCLGKSIQIDKSFLPELQKREGGYSPISTPNDLLKIIDNDGNIMDGLVYFPDKNGKNYLDNSVTIEEKVQIIKNGGEGENGNTRDYLKEIYSFLRKHNIEDEGINKLYSSIFIRNNILKFKKIFKEINISEIYTDKNNDKFHRFNSWEHCYKAFDGKHDNDYLALHLAFYLASWGMYRGSSKLLQKDYKIHVEAVGIINNYRGLRNVIISTENLDIIIQLIDELVSYYDNNGVSATDTLISKIIMGTLGCLPAFDRFFKDGVVANNLKFKSLKKSSLESLFSFIEENINQLESLQKQVNKQQKIDYPIMKIVDMLFWNNGFIIDENKKKK